MENGRLRKTPRDDALLSASVADEVQDAFHNRRRALLQIHVDLDAGKVLKDFGEERNAHALLREGTLAHFSHKAVARVPRAHLGVGRLAKLLASAAHALARRIV